MNLRTDYILKEIESEVNTNDITKRVLNWNIYLNLECKERIPLYIHKQEVFDPFVLNCFPILHTGKCSICKNII